MKPYSYLALGDSYTIGEKVPSTENFPNQAVAFLNNSNGFRFELPEIIAVTGWTTDELKAGIAAAGMHRSFDWVTLLIGVNNQYRGRGTEDYAKEFRELLDQAIAFADKLPERVVVLSIPDWGITPFAIEKEPARIAAEIDAFNQVNSSISKAKGVHYLDVTPSSRTNGRDLAYLVEDGLHYSGREYAIWARDLADIIIRQLQKENGK